MAKNKKDQEKPRVHRDLDGFEVSIDSFGELKSNISIDQINEFLNKKVDDKKLRDRKVPDEDKK